MNVRAALTLCLIALSVAVLLAAATGFGPADQAARSLFCALCLLGLTTSTIREWLLLTAALILAALLIRSGAAGYETLWSALDLAAFFAAFIALLTVLKIAAERSRGILTVGHYLTAQRAGRRYYATALGGHVFGVFLNFGAISLMAPLIQKSAVTADGTPDPALERRQLTGLMRGFAWILLWAPTTLSQAVLLTLFTDVDWPRLVVIGLATSVVMIGIGRLYDRWEWPRSLAEAPKLAVPWSAMGKVAAVCTLLIAGTLTLRAVAGFSTALALMFVAPAVTAAWFAAQARAGTGRMGDLPGILSASAPALARSGIALGLSGFIGRALAQVLPVEAWAAAADLSSVPGWLFLATLPILITLGGQVAISPIMLVVFIGQVIATIPVLPAEPTHIVFALSAGWAISMLASPNATATLLVSATTGIAPTTLTWRWNLKYALICYVVFVGIFALLTA
ncbi:hypothetical protein [Jannaschia sp. 2305UL9-9]|uniref:hypothetical protein n=1 Tax=Jannaschia sp. 2305UL9-9 TaxID=3121638 RepID=UPI003527F4E1